MKELILDILEKHYHGRNFIEKRCADELEKLFDEWRHWDEEHTLDMVMNDMVCDLTERDIECILEGNDNPKEPNKELTDAAVNTTTFQFTTDITPDIDEDNDEWDGFTDTSFEQDDYNDELYDY